MECHNGHLGGGFNFFIYFHPYLPGEMMQFDDCAYSSNGLVQLNHHPESWKVFVRRFWELCESRKTKRFELLGIEMSIRWERDS